MAFVDELRSIVPGEEEEKRQKAWQDRIVKDLIKEIKLRAKVNAELGLEHHLKGYLGPGGEDGIFIPEMNQAARIGYDPSCLKEKTIEAIRSLGFEKYEVSIVERKLPWDDGVTTHISFIKRMKRRLNPTFVSHMFIEIWW